VKRRVFVDFSIRNFRRLDGASTALLKPAALRRPTPAQMPRGHAQEPYDTRGNSRVSTISSREVAVDAWSILDEPLTQRSVSEPQPEHRECDMVASKRDAIAAIIGLNPTAKPAFLAEFSKDDLERYLDRLGRVIMCEDGAARMVPDFPAVAGEADTVDEVWW